MAKMFLNYLSEGISNFGNISNDKTIARATLLLRRQLTAIFGLYKLENKGPFMKITSKVLDFRISFLGS